MNLTEKQVPANVSVNHLPEIISRLLRAEKNDYVFPREQLDKASSLLNFTSAVVAVIDATTRKYIYVSDNSEKIVGYSPEIFYGYSWEDVIGLFPKEHHQYVLDKMFPKIWATVEEHSIKGTCKDISFVYTTRILDGHGKRSWYMHQLHVVETDEKNNPLLLLKLVTNIDDIKQDESLTFFVKQRIGGEVVTVFSETYNTSGNSLQLSPREKEVIQLLRQGKTSREIAEMLFLSHHTVLKHRKNMLKKLEVSRTAELLSKCISLGIL